MTQAVFRPTGAGLLTEIGSQYPASGSHWDKVDEETADENATRVYIITTPGTWQTDLFSFTPTVMGGRINFVRVHRRTGCNPVHPEYSSTKSALLVSGESVPAFSDATSDPGDSAYHDHYYDWTVNPITSSQWTWSEFFLLQFGVSIYHATYGDTNCTQCYMTVDYTLEDASDMIFVGML